jgi:hypothetical protein
MQLGKHLQQMALLTAALSHQTQHRPLDIQETSFGCQRSLSSAQFRIVPRKPRIEIPGNRVG